MDREQLRKFVDSHGIFIMMLIGLILIGIKATVTGVIIYGIGIHISLAVFMIAVYNPKFYEDALVKAKLEIDQKIKKSKLRRIKTSAVMFCFMAVLGYRQRWYLFLITIVTLALFCAVTKVAHEDLKKEKENEMSQGKL